MRHVAALLIAFCLSLPTTLSAEGCDSYEPIVFSTPSTPGSPTFFFYLDLYTEAFDRLCYHFNMEPAPVRRSLYNASKGVTDGDTARIAQVVSHSDFTDLVLVDEPIGSVEVGIFSRSPTDSFSGWQDLDAIRGTDALIAHSRGFLVAETELARHVDASNILTTSSGLQGCLMLGYGRVNYLVEPRPVVDSLIHDGQCSGEYVHLAGILETVSTYPVLNRRHADLAPRLAEAIRQIKEEGLFDTFRERFQAP